MAVMIYALYTYHWRAASIRRGGRGPYDDRFGMAKARLTSPSTDLGSRSLGPTLLCIALLSKFDDVLRRLTTDSHPVAIIVNFVLRFTT